MRKRAETTPGQRNNMQNTIPVGFNRTPAPCARVPTARTAVDTARRGRYANARTRQPALFRLFVWPEYRRFKQAPGFFRTPGYRDFDVRTLGPVETSPKRAGRARAR